MIGFLDIMMLITDYMQSQANFIEYFINIVLSKLLGVSIM